MRMILEQHPRSSVVRLAYWLYLLDGINRVGLVVVALISQLPGSDLQVDLRPLAAGMLLTGLLGAAEIRVALLLRQSVRLGAWLALGLAALLLVSPAIGVLRSGPGALFQLEVAWRATIVAASLGAWYRLARP